MLNMFWLAVFMGIFSFYLTLDAHLLMTGMYQKHVKPTDYVYGASKTFTDIIAIFILLILMCVKGGNGGQGSNIA